VRRIAHDSFAGQLRRGEQAVVPVPGAAEVDCPVKTPLGCGEKAAEKLPAGVSKEDVWRSLAQATPNWTDCPLRLPEGEPQRLRNEEAWSRLALYAALGKTYGGPGRVGGD
jgi:hypothetical protein